MQFTSGIVSVKTEDTCHPVQQVISYTMSVRDNIEGRIYVQRMSEKPTN